MYQQIPVSLVILILIPTLSHGDVPGYFFWKPRLGIDMRLYSSTGPGLPAHKENINAGLVVIVRAYYVGFTSIALCEAISAGFERDLPQFHPLKADMYTQWYRWFRRHLSLFPEYLSRDTSTYPQTHRIWKQRYRYMDEFLPKWMRYLFPYVSNKEWNKLEREHKAFAESHAGETFSKHYTYPSKKFNDFLTYEENSGYSTLSHS